MPISLRLGFLIVVSVAGLLCKDKIDRQVVIFIGQEFYDQGCGSLAQRYTQELGQCKEASSPLPSLEV